MRFIDLVQEYVTLYKSGKNMVGPCPKCGGESDSTRFVVNMVKDFGNCYSCGFNADPVRLLREMEGMSCPEAHAAVGKECDRPECPAWSGCSRGRGEHDPRRDDRATAAPRRRAQRAYVPSVAETPVEMWQRHAMDMVMVSHERLLKCPEQLDYLAGRGLPLDAIFKYRLGWIPKLEFKDRKSWGLQDKWDEKQQKTIKAMPFHKGILIPWFIDGKVHRLRYRKHELSGPKDPRYMWVDGSGTDIVCLNPAARAHCIVESDLCGLLIDYVAGDLVGSVPLGSCSTHPKATVHALLSNSLRILVSTDYDGEVRAEKVHAPGGKAYRWWAEHFPATAKRWPVPRAKDPGEAYGAGADLRVWVLAGLPPAMTVRAFDRSRAQEGSMAWDQDKAWRLVTAARSELTSSCPPGAQEWLQTQSEIKEHLSVAEAGVDNAFQIENEAALVQALERFVLWHKRAWEVFGLRPPVVEVPK